MDEDPPMNGDPTETTPIASAFNKLPNESRRDFITSVVYTYDKWAEKHSGKNARVQSRILELYDMGSIEPEAIETLFRSGDMDREVRATGVPDPKILLPKNMVTEEPTEGGKKKRKTRRRRTLKKKKRSTRKR